MTSWSQGPRSTTDTQGWIIPSIVTHNVNSLSSTNTGGITGRFAKIISLLTFLVLSHNIICLQDIRIPTDSFIACLKPIFPNFNFVSSAHSTTSAGVVTIYPNSFHKDYTISNEVIDDGYILATAFYHKKKKKQFTVINTYLHSSNNALWNNQINKLRSHHHNPNTIILGDFNHAANEQDRSGYHGDKPNYCKDNFQNFLTNGNFEEIYQKYHTCYNMQAGKLASSRIDHVYHNMDTVTLALLNPKATVITTAPHTVTYNGISGRSNDWHNSQDDYSDRQLIDSYEPNSKGGNHITDHLPIAVRFTNNNNIPKRKFISRAANNKHFKKTFQDIWYLSTPTIGPLRCKNWVAPFATPHT